MLSHHRRPLAIGLISIATLCLVACSDGAPSSGDIEQALKSGMSEAITQAKNSGSPVGTAMTNVMSKVEIHSVKNLGCKKDNAGVGYNCKVEMDVTSPFAGRQKNTRTLHLVKGHEGWEIAR